MAEPLKHQFGLDVPRRIAAQVAAVWPAFDPIAFARDAEARYEALELMDRARQIAHALRRHLPPDFEHALQLLMASIGPPPASPPAPGMAAFHYLPHTLFVAEYGLGHFEASMRAQYELTKRFTAEFSIRRFLEHDRERTLDRLAQWADDADARVRRLVSEGTRPRLPWAPRLRAFERDPQPQLALLERLKDDADAAVRRSVANHLNDIGKGHPQLLLQVARRWLRGATPQREALVRHALRSSVKSGDAAALALLGADAPARVAVENVAIAPARPRIGDAVRIALTLRSTARRTQRLVADLRIHFLKASGQAQGKVFKLRTLDLGPGESVALKKTISLAQLTTRRHHAGVHEVELLLNGRPRALGRFDLRPAR